MIPAIVILVSTALAVGVWRKRPSARAYRAWRKGDAAKSLEELFR